MMRGTKVVTPAELSVESRAQEILDLVVISFLVLEKNRRMAAEAGRPP